MQVLHKFDHNGKTYKFVLDEFHETVGSYAYDTPEETKAAEDEEIAKLESYEWQVVCCIVEEPCSGILPVELEGAPRAALHCACCQAHGGKLETNSVWGIVLDNSINAMEQFVKEGGI